jgi:hypothetical protein
MRIVEYILNAAWVGTAIGLVGIALAIFFFLRRREIWRLAYQTRSVRLIGDASATLPEDVVITVKGVPVPRLSKTTVIIWNAGTATVRGGDIVAMDPLRIRLDDDAAALDVRIPRTSRSVISAAAHANPQTKNEVMLGFDFLDPQDGFTVDIIHSGTTAQATTLGTVRGLSGGLCDWGRATQAERPRLPPRKGLIAYLVLTATSKPPLVAIIVLGAAIALAGLFPDVPLHFFPKLAKPGPGTPALVAGQINWAPLIFGLVYAAPPIAMLWSRRRRYPRKLGDDS